MFRTKVTLALAMKGEMPLKRLSDDSLWLFSSQDGHGHGWDVQIWLDDSDDVRCLNVFSTSTWHIWHIIQCHSQYRSIIFDHSESFYFLRARGAMVFIFMQLLASIFAALLALLTSGRHQNNIWYRDETILSIFMRAMYSWCHCQECVRLISTWPAAWSGNVWKRTSTWCRGQWHHQAFASCFRQGSPLSALSALLRFQHVWSGSGLWPSKSLLYFRDLK